MDLRLVLTSENIEAMDHLIGLVTDLQASYHELEPGLLGFYARLEDLPEIKKRIEQYAFIPSDFSFRDFEEEDE